MFWCPNKLAWYVYVLSSLFKSWLLCWIINTQTNELFIALTLWRFVIWMRRNMNFKQERSRVYTGINTKIDPRSQTMIMRHNGCRATQLGKFVIRPQAMVTCRRRHAQLGGYIFKPKFIVIRLNSSSSDLQCSSFLWFLQRTKLGVFNIDRWTDNTAHGEVVHNSHRFR